MITEMRYNELCGVLGVLKTNGMKLDWQKIDKTLRQHAANGTHEEYAQQVIRGYRRMAIDEGWLGIGEIPSQFEAVNLVEISHD